MKVLREIIKDHSDLELIDSLFGDEKLSQLRNNYELEEDDPNWGTKQYELIVTVKRGKEIKK